MRPTLPYPLRAVVRILLLALSALAIFGATALLCAIPLLLFRDNVHASAGIITVGIVCGLIAWLFVANFHMRKVSLTLVCEDRSSFLARLRKELEELGYEAGETRKGHTVYKPGFSAYLLGGGVHVTENISCIVVTGPKVFVEMLRKRMKILQHLMSVQQTIHDSRVRQGRHLLRRVEIDLRVSAAQWLKIHEEVISVLARQEANIVCEVHILAQNESGILDEVVEMGIRERLRQENIRAEIRKEGRPSGEHKLVAASAR